MCNGRGIGTELIRAVAEQAREYGSMSINVTVGNDSARRLYEKLGSIHYNEIPNDDFYQDRSGGDSASVLQRN